MHICTNINYIHNLFSMPSLISKINRKKVCSPPSLHCQGLSFKILITLCTTKYEIRITTGINMQNFCKRQNHWELISTHFVLYVSRMSGLFCNLLHCLK